MDPMDLTGLYISPYCCCGWRCCWLSDLFLTIFVSSRSSWWRYPEMTKISRKCNHTVLDGGQMWSPRLGSGNAPRSSFVSNQTKIMEEAKRFGREIIVYQIFSESHPVTCSPEVCSLFMLSVWSSVLHVNICFNSTRWCKNLVTWNQPPP